MEGSTNVLKNCCNSVRSELRSMMRPSVGSTSSLSLSTHRRQPSTSTVQSPPVPRRPPLSSTSSTTSTNGSDLVHQGWLTKSPPPRGIFKPKWRRRWFILKAGLYPNQFVLEYFTDSTCRRQKGHINLDECEQIQGGPPPAQDRHKFTFNLRTPSRTYYLASDSEAEMTKWVSCLCQVCGIKNTETEAEIYKPSDENNQPAEVEEQQENLVSDESSPTLSSVSSAYIPISECFTGKPILFNDKAYEKERIYCNTSTSFPFPPKVNWATHPGKKEPSSDNSAVATPSPSTALVSNSSAAAPPRPPKKPGSATVPDIAITVPETDTSETNKPEKTQNAPSADRTVFSYDDCVGDNHDSSSTCSSLQSPPGSAGALYCNISNQADAKAGSSPTGPIYQNPSALLPSKSESCQVNPIPSPGGPDSASNPPPRVNRKLKPEVNKPLLSPAPNKFQAHKHSSGAMTLPNRNNFRQLSVSVGPAIDRTRKPPESPIMLGPTPAQVKNQASSSSLRHHAQVGSTSTLPASPRKRVGPIVSPHGHDQRLPVYHEYDQPEDLIGTYTQIDCKSIAKAAKDIGLGGEATNSHHSKVILHKKGTQVQKEEGSVEYRLIDHVKTEALNKMRQEREEQLVRTNPISLKSFN